MFSKLHTEDDFAGSGLGLALCKKIMHPMKGDIYVSSELAKSSKFQLEFPMQREYKIVESKGS